MDLNQSRILHISKYYYPFLGGTEQVARDVVRTFSSLGVKQKVICFNEDASDGIYSCNHRETIRDFVDDVEVIRCGYLFKISSQALSITYCRELKKIMADFRPNIIFFHYPNPFVAHYLLKYKDLEFKLLVYWHLDITKQKFLRNLFYFQNIALIERANKILGATPCHVEKSVFTYRFGNKKYILPYMIDEENLNISADEINKGKMLKKKYEGKILGFFIGRHVPYKGLTYLIKASKMLGDINMHFFIAGTGILTDSLKKEAMDDSKIEFLGRISDSERRSYLYACDIILFPSITRNEGFGLALAEGMYFGHPAVTFNIPGSGVNYVNLNGITGIECNNSNYALYAEALRTLARNSELRLRMGQEARRRVINNFTSTCFKKNLMNLISIL